MKNNCTCRSCDTPERQKNRSASHIGYVMPQKTKDKISIANKGKNKTPHTEERKQKSSEVRKGKNFYIRTEKWKTKMRIIALKRLERLGIGAGVDNGAIEWFSKYNTETNSNFKPKRFWNIGYDADGYDEQKHIWIEYDTPYHKNIRQKTKDIIRQNNIIKYFESINNPLKAFMRYLEWTGELKTIYSQPLNHA